MQYSSEEKVKTAAKEEEDFFTFKGAIFREEENGRKNDRNKPNKYDKILFHDFIKVFSDRMERTGLKAAPKLRLF